jgi:hypothetical protein
LVELDRAKSRLYAADIGIRFAGLEQQRANAFVLKFRQDKE